MLLFIEPWNHKIDRAVHILFFCFQLNEFFVINSSVMRKKFVERIHTVSLSSESSNSSTPSTPAPSNNWFELPCIEFYLMGDEHRDEVSQLVINTFFRDEPLNQHLNFNLPDEPKEFTDLVLSQALEDRCSFVAIDVQTQKIIGVILNVIKCRSLSSSDEDEIEFKSEKLRFILSILKGLHRTIDLFERIKTDRLLHVAVIAIDAYYRGLRLTEKLVRISLERAKKDLHLHAAYSEATSLYSAKAFRKQGFQLYSETIYADYDRNRLADLIGDHDRCQLLAKEL